MTGTMMKEFPKPSWWNTVTDILDRYCRSPYPIMEISDWNTEFESAKACYKAFKYAIGIRRNISCKVKIIDDKVYIYVN